MKSFYAIEIIIFCIVSSQIIFAEDSKEVLDSLSRLHEFPHRTHEDHLLFDVVVSHCRASLHWLGRELAGLNKDAFQVRRIFIYSKCNIQPTGINFLDSDLVSIESLPNVGRCDHTYAYHLAHFYDDLAPHILFLKDSYYISAISKQISLQDLLTYLSDHWFACGREPLWKQSVWHVRQRMWKFRLPVYVTAEDRSGGRNQYDILDSRADWRGPDSLSLCGLLRSSLPPEDIRALADLKYVPACYGGSFGTTSSMVRRYAQQTWSRFELALSRTDNIEEGHFMERLWASLLSPPADFTLASMLEQSSFDPHDTIQDFSASYRGSLAMCSSNPCDLKLVHQAAAAVGMASNPSPRTQIVIVSPSLQADHSPQYAFLLGFALNKMGYRVVVISATGRGLENDFVAAGIEVVIIPSFTPSDPKSTMGQFFKLLEERKIDPIYVFWNTIRWAPILNTHSRYLKTEPRMVWIIHELQIDEHSTLASQYPMLKNYETRTNLQDDLDAVVFLTEHQREQWIFSDTGNTFVIPGYSRLSTMSELPRMEVTRSSLDIPDDAVVITMVGPFLPHRRQHWMFDLLDALEFSHFDVRILLIGGPNQGYSGEPDYVKQITSKALLSRYRQRMLIVPFTPNPFQYLALANLHISASVEDAFPLNVVEAMSMGVPVLAPDSDGVAELFSEKTMYFLMRNVTDSLQVITRTKLLLNLHKAGKLQQFGQMFQQSAKRVEEVFTSQLSSLIRRLENQIEEISLCNMLDIPDYFEKPPRPPNNGLPNPRTVYKLNPSYRLPSKSLKRVSHG